jgi:hypothetical protein
MYITYKQLWVHSLEVHFYYFILQSKIVVGCSHQIYAFHQIYICQLCKKIIYDQQFKKELLELAKCGEKALPISIHLSVSDAVESCRINTAYTTLLPYFTNRTNRRKCKT